MVGKKSKILRDFFLSVLLKLLRRMEDKTSPPLLCSRKENFFLLLEEIGRWFFKRKEQQQTTTKTKICNVSKKVQEKKEKYSNILLIMFQLVVSSQVKLKYVLRSRAGWHEKTSRKRGKHARKINLILCEDQKSSFPCDYSLPFAFVKK